LLWRGTRSEPLRWVLPLMTVDTRVRRTTPWTPRIAVQLTVLAAAAFVYVTAEMVPVAALPAIALDLRVSEGLVATLLASYALVAAVTTVPLVRMTASWPRRRTLLVTLASLTVSQAVSALAPNFAVLAGGRVLCAVTHGLMWSVIAPIATRLVPPTHSGRATMAIYGGTSIALVVGNPLTAAMSQMWGWRLAVVMVTVAAAAVTVTARLTLPPLVLSAHDIEVGQEVRGHLPHHRNGRLVTLSVLTLVGVTAHFISYTFIVVIIRDVVGVHGAHLAWLLAAFGVAGLISMAATARPLDLWPKATVVGCLGTLAAAFVLLAWLASGRHAGPVTVLCGVAAIIAWGAASTALPPMLQSAAMRTAPDDPDGASGLYVAAFQVGIMAGSLCGGLLYEDAGAGVMLAASAALMVFALAGVTATKALFGVTPLTNRK
jgi:predicted MFS family arabinose efflux permease